MWKTTDPNPIDWRDLVISEPNGFVREGAIRQLIARGWPAAAIMAEIPGVSEEDIRRAADREHASAA